MATQSSRPTIEELRNFARLPWVRCTGCNRITGDKQDRFDAILKNKEKTYYDNVIPIFERLLDEGQDERTAEITADKEARLAADITFNREVKEQLNLRDTCCFNTLFNPIVLPLGSGIGLDPEVDVGERMSQLTIKPKVKPVLPGAKGEVVPQARKARIYTAR